jgi:hypothetical protein
MIIFHLFSLVDQNICAFNTVSNMFVSRSGMKDCGLGCLPQSSALGFYLWVVLDTFKMKPLYILRGAKEKIVLIGSWKLKRDASVLQLETSILLYLRICDAAIIKLS